MKRAIALASGLVLSASVALAGDESGAKTFSQLDTDGDGVLTKSEASIDRALLARFRSVDVNQDGYLTHKEFDSIEAESEEAE